MNEKMKTRTMGVSEHLYNRIAELAEQAGVSVRQMADELLARQLLKTTVKRVISFGDDKDVVIEEPGKVFPTPEAEVVVVGEVQAPEVRGIEVTQRPEDPGSMTVSQMFIEILREEKRPISSTEMRDLVEKKYGRRVGNPMGWMVGNRIFKRHETTPATFSLAEHDLPD